MDDQCIRQLYDQGLSDGQIAMRIGCCRSAVGKARQRLGLLTNDVPAVDEARLRTLHKARCTDFAIATGLGCSESSVRAARGRLGLAAWPREKHGRRRTAAQQKPRYVTPQKVRDREATDAEIETVVEVSLGLRPPLTLRQTGRVLDLSGERVRNIEARALAKLAELLEGRGYSLADFPFGAGGRRMADRIKEGPRRPLGPRGRQEAAG